MKRSCHAHFGQRNFESAHGTQKRSCSGYEVSSDGPLSSRPHAAPAVKAMLGVDWGAACACCASREAVSRRRQMLCEYGSRIVDMVLYHMPDELNAAPQQGSRLMGLANCRKTFSPAQVRIAFGCQAKGREGLSDSFLDSDLSTDLPVVNSRQQSTFDGCGLRFLFFKVG